MDLNLILTYFWLFISVGIFIPGLWLLMDGKSHLKIIDLILQRFYLFGKLKNENQKKIKIFTDIPKRYFLHFYIFGLLINLILLFYFQSSILLFTIYLCHISRRLYECLYIHRFGLNSTMSIIHYVIGLIHYPLVGLTIIIDGINNDNQLSLFNICLGLLLFLNASYIQYHVHLTLAKIHRNENENYPIPNGYWPFQYFSCPNYIAEIILYISFLLISHHTTSFFALFIWVFINQSLSALLTHQWYCQYYGNKYPSTRYALIPYLI